MSEKKKSFVWKYFKEDKVAKKVQCILCKVNLSHSDTSTSSMVKHLSNIHKKDAGTDSVGTSQKTLTSFGVIPGRLCDPKRQAKITDMIAEMIARHHLPLEMVEWPGFRKLLHFLEPNYKPVTSSTVKTAIHSKADEMKSAIQAEIKNVDAISITTDGWTSCSNDSFMAVTASYVNEMFELKTPVLATIHLEERHFAGYLEEQLVDEMECWGVRDKIVSIVHDNAYNIAKIARNTDTGVDIGCAAHTFQLCVRDAMGLKTQTATPNHVIAKAVNAASRLVSHFNHSPAATNTLLSKQALKPPVKLIQYCRTRWNSICDMFERLLRVKNAISDVIDEKEAEKVGSTRDFAMTDQVWSVIKAVTPILLKLKIANSLLCGEKHVSISTVYPVMYTLADHLKEFSIHEAIVLQIFKKDLLAQLERKFFSNHNDFIIKATILDPRFRTLQNIPGAIRARIERELLEEVQESVVIVQQEETVDMRSESADSDVDEPAEKIPRLDNDSFFGDKFLNTPTTPAEEFNHYLQEPILDRNMDPLLWWRRQQTRFPRLSKMSKRYLSTPATSVASERHFSQAGLLISKRRARLLPESSQSLLFLNHNMLQY